MKGLRRLWWAWCDACIRVADSRFLAATMDGIVRIGTRVGRALPKLYKSGVAEGLGAWLDKLTLNDDPVLAGPRGRVMAFVRRKGRVWIKIRIATILLVAAAIAMLLKNSAPSKWVCAGMAFSWLGAAMLMEFKPISAMVRQVFLWGMFCYALAQLCYIHALRLLYIASGSYMHWPMWALAGFFCLLSVLEMCRSVLPNTRQPIALRVGALPYAMLVSTMCGFAVAVCIATVGKGWLVMLAGILFYLSDMLVALNTLGGLRMQRRDFWVWILYAPAQLLLVWGVTLL